MEIQQLRLFTSLCKHLHFGNAGVESHMSPSAVSRNIQRLEVTIGHKLFLRDNRSLSLTEQGEIFRRYAVDVLSRWDALNLELSQSEDELTGHLTLFASKTASRSILPKVLSTFRHDYPGIQIQLETGYAVNALKRLFEGCDVVVAALPPAQDERRIERISGEEELLQGDIDWSRVPLIKPSSRQSTDNIINFPSKHSVRPDIDSEVSGNEAILSLVALECGVGFVPKSGIKGSPLTSKVRKVESGPSLSDFRVGLCARRSSLASSEIIQAFWQSI